MIVLADNDIILKLARCDLFAEFLAAFNVSISDICILKVARFSITSKKQRQRLGEECFTRLSEFLSCVADIVTAPNPMAIAALTEQTDKNIDAGEAVLFAICPLIPDAIIVTGDKKSLAGLVSAAREDEDCLAIGQALQGRVYCFEQVLQRILASYGFDSIRQKLIEGRECDRGLALWLGSGLNATESGFLDGLNSFLNEARQNSGDLLAT